MTTEQIIKACQSKKWDVENLILRGEVGVIPLAQHFGLDLTKSTSDLKHAIIDCLNESATKPDNLHEAV